MDTDIMPESVMFTDASKLVGAQVKLTNPRVGTTITAKVVEAKVERIDPKSPLYVEGISYVSSIKVEGLWDSLSILTPFVSDYSRKNGDNFIVEIL